MTVSRSFNFIGTRKKEEYLKMWLSGSATALAMRGTKIGYKANINVMKAAQETDKHLLDLIG